MKSICRPRPTTSTAMCRPAYVLFQRRLESGKLGRHNVAKEVDCTIGITQHENERSVYRHLHWWWRHAPCHHHSACCCCRNRALLIHFKRRLVNYFAEVHLCAGVLGIVLECLLYILDTYMKPSGVLYVPPHKTRHCQESL